MTTRVLIADDHPTFRRGLGALLASLADLEVVGEAPDGEAAVAVAAHLLPDVVVMDLNMPGLNGVEATRRIVSANPGIAVLVLTMLDEDEGDAVFGPAVASRRRIRDRTQDRPQPGQQHLQQTAGDRPFRGDLAGPRRRSWQLILRRRSLGRGSGHRDSAGRVGVDTDGQQAWRPMPWPW
jgi:CheY-like chemotaxis protein